MSISLGAMADSDGTVKAADIVAALGHMSDPRDLEDMAVELSGVAENMPPASEMLESALGVIEGLGAVLSNPKAGGMRPHIQSLAFAATERMRGIINATTRLQVKDGERPNVFLASRFTHAAPGIVTLFDQKPSLPGQDAVPTQNGPLVLIQARVFIVTGAYNNATLNINVARIDAAQYAGAGAAVLTGLPIEMFAPHAYRPGIKPPFIRGLERANSNTVIGYTSTAFAPVDYIFVLEFRMEAFIGGPCGRVMPSLLRGPMRLTVPGARR